MAQDQERSAERTVKQAARAAFWRGVRTTPIVPSAILLSGMVGFGALTRELGFGLEQAIGISAAIWALPGQVMLVDQFGRGATAAAAFLAVMLTAIRLLPMAVVLSPLLRDPAADAGPQKWWHRLGLLIAAHFVALTLWIEGQRLLPGEPRAARLPIFLGWCAVLFPLSLLATALGFAIAGAVPPKAGAILLFLTPLYFGLSMIPALRLSRPDAAAITFGAALGPVLHILIPNADLLIVGLCAALLHMVLERRNVGR